MSRPGMVLPGALVLALFLALLPAGGLRADIPEGVALLQSRPREGRGLPFLPANTVRYLSASYRYGDVLLELYLIPALPGEAPAPDDAGSSWDPFQCPPLGAEVRSGDSPQADLVLRSVYQGVLVYLVTPREFSEHCQFLRSFLELFIFFLDSSPGQTLQRQQDFFRRHPEFPAVLELE
ncbi:hypothetical protein [Alkalispirochaeta sphaeroplastigenens]|nr:hypothetical protein [Alkalispirochaeta sphaeroplastigenens]